ncbi:MAG TPA: polysaccharide deacetylase family protein [Candidatus Nanoarchaeia archaeon]|nr:polysaccharide deacetylase family protein [Candidatus Nanoarchaeia archaeon]
MKKLWLTFDIEEFDLLKRYNNKESIYEISKNGTINILNLLKETNIQATFFVTLSFAKKYPELILKIKEDGHEIGSHGYQHSHDYSKLKNPIKYLKIAREELEKITKTRIIGFRAPNLKAPKYSIIKKAGFEYSSNLHPTFIPGYYNNLTKPTKPFIKNGIKEYPITVFPYLRLPLFWIAFRFLPLIYFNLAYRLNKNYFMLYFHPWEFINLNKIKQLPFTIRYNTGKKLIFKLKKFITENP